MSDDDLAVHIDPDLMVDACRTMQDRAAAVHSARRNLYLEMKGGKVFGEGEDPNTRKEEEILHSYHMPEFSTGWWIFGTDFCEAQTFTARGDAPWTEELHGRWTASIENRAAEGKDVGDELNVLAYSIVRYLEDATDIDLENKGIITDSASSLYESEDDGYASER